jgi:recombination protein RecT
MACKTVTKLLLAKYAPMSVEMEKAAVADQAIIMNDSGTDVTYIDNHEEIPMTKEDIQRDRLQKLIDNAKSADDLVKIRSQVPSEMHDLFNEIAEGKNF